MTEETLTILRIDGDPASLTVQQLRDNIKKLKGELSDLTIGTEKYQSTLTSLIANQNALRGAMNGTAASLDETADAAVGTVNSYNGLVAKMAELNREFRSMDTASDEGKARMRELGAEINAVNDQLKAMDALRGNYQRNVGNYRSALNGLNLAMAQVVRELPSMAISVNTFFLAISNNIPILADQIANLRAQNELALARGEKTVSVLGSVVKSLFSWNTVLTLVITAVTLFGDKLIDMIANLFKAKDAALDTAKALENVKEAVDFGNLGEQIANMERLSNIFRSLGDDAEAKREFVEKYKDELEKTGVEIKNVADAEKLLIKNKDNYIQSLKARAMATAAMNLAGEEFEKSLRAQTEAEKLKDEYDKKVQTNMRGSIRAWNKYAEAANEAYYANQKAYEYIKIANDLFGPLEEDSSNGGSGNGSGTKDNTLDYIRQMQDAQLALLNDGYEKQLAERRLYYERQIEDLKNTLETEENLTAEGRAAINETIRALTLQGEQESARIMEEWEQSKRDIAQETTEALIRDGEQLSRELDREEKENERRRERERSQTRKWAQEMQDAQLRQIDADKRKALSENENATGINEGERAEREYQIIQEANQKKLELYRQFEQDALNAMNPQLAIQMKQRAADMEVEITRTSAERQKEIYDNLQAAKQQSYQNIISGTTTLLNTLADLYEQDAENSEEAAQKSKNLQIAATTISTISGAVSAYMGAIKAFENTGPGAIAGPIVGAVQAALVLATGLAQIQKIKNTDVNKDKSPSGSVGGISASVSAPTVTPNVTHVRNITSASEEDRLNRIADDQRVYILASDIEASQNQRRTVVREASF